MKAEDEAATLAADQAAVAGTGVKALVPIDGRPFLDYVLSGLADAGCTEVCLVIGPEHAALRDRYSRVIVPRRVRVRYAIQETPRGTGDAVLAASGFVGGDEFLMINSDNYYPVRALRALVAMGHPGTVLFTPEGLAAHSNIEPARVRGFALAKVSADGYLEGLVEKPDEATARAMGAVRRVSMNCWRFPPAIFEVCRNLVPSARGELEITDAVASLIARGQRFEVLTSDEGVLDLSRRSDIAPVLERLRGVRVEL
jgi:glucose-1-phosphate thymidylyltransferase